MNGLALSKVPWNAGITITFKAETKDQGPVVQSIVSLTKSLVNDSLSLLVRLKSSVLIFFAENMWGALHCKSSSHFFSAKNGSVFMYNMFEILTSR